MSLKKPARETFPQIQHTEGDVTVGPGDQAVCHVCTKLSCLFGTYFTGIKVQE